MTYAPKRWFVLALGITLAALGSVRPAAAGSLRVRDEAHALSPEDIARVRGAVSGAPFDGRLVVTDEYADADQLSRYVGSLLTEPGAVAVGIDPRHRHVQVHFGVGSHVPRSEWPAIERAGNDAFRRGEYAVGAEAIFRAAARVVEPAGAAAPPAVEGEERPALERRPSLFGPALLFVLVAGALGLAFYFARRRSSFGGGGPAGYPGAPYGGGPPYAGGPGYPMGYGPPGQGGMGAVGGGLLGAGLGGLAGYELGKMEGEREERQRDVFPGRDVDRDPPPENDDAGGGGSSWDDGGSSGSDDGGGGGDFGGDSGGGDSGGGGSDWG